MRKMSEMACRIFARSTTLVALTLVLATPAVAGDGAGQKVFVDQKCNQCHTIKDLKIGLVGVPEGNPTDLSAAGTLHAGDWMKAFLLKKEVLNGQKHKRKFLGPDSELSALVTWLGSLKGVK